VPKGRVKILSSKMVYEGKVFGVRHDVVVEPGAKPAGRDIVTHPGSVVVLPVLNDGRILMIRQYRRTADAYLLEVVAGRKERGENNLKAAKRELAEETGYRAKRFREMMDVYPSPGFVEETMVAFAATGLSVGKTNFDADEIIESKPFTLKALLEMIRKGQLHDAKSVASHFPARRFVVHSR